MLLRLALADDHPTFRAGLRAHLDREPDLEVVAEASSGPEALAVVAEHAPDVLVLDMEMPGLTGLDVVERLIAFSEARGHTILDLAFAYLLAHEPVASVIAGATKPSQIGGNVAAAAWTLSPDDLAEVDAVLATTAAS